MPLKPQMSTSYNLKTSMMTMYNQNMEEPPVNDDFDYESQEEKTNNPTPMSVIN